MSALTHFGKGPGITFPRSRRPVIVFVAALVAYLALSLGYRVAFAGRVFPGVTVRGIALGGLTRGEVSGLLTSRLQPNVEKPLVVTTEAHHWTLSRTALGAHYDVDNLT